MRHENVFSGILKCFIIKRDDKYAIVFQKQNVLLILIRTLGYMRWNDEKSNIIITLYIE